MTSLPRCPACNSEYTYEDGDNYVCPECAHEWPKHAATEATEAQKVVVLLEGSLTYLSHRMKLVEGQLQGEDRMALAASPAAQATRF